MFDAIANDSNHKSLMYLFFDFESPPRRDGATRHAAPAGCGNPSLFPLWLSLKFCDALLNALKRIGEVFNLPL